MLLNQITPLVLTFNESANIARTLKQLSWANDIVVVDSFSQDETVEIASRFPQVRIFQRAFDTHRNQWTYGLTSTGIETDWVLALDADYVLTDDFVDEMKLLRPNAAIHGYSASFRYCLNGTSLRSGIYPPVTVLYRRAAATYEQDGHTHRVRLDGQVRNLEARVLHDDRKPLMSWFNSQAGYTELEAQKLLTSKASHLEWPDRIRRLCLVAPPIVFIYCLFLRGGIFDGWAGIQYALQRTVAELMLSVHLIQHQLTVHRPSDALVDSEIADLNIQNAQIKETHV
jgi:glycosyltransferase involved in cell wall biosynthesis